uniref:DUF4939 domain-containing protein n=1 Tax=Sander lucioperca TaxID=283035 RepID=A0A8D0D940_SANLU
LFCHILLLVHVLFVFLFYFVNSLDLPAVSVSEISPAAVVTSASSGGGSSGVTVPFSPFPHLARPERFSGESGDCRSFLTQCEIHFELQAAAYPTDRAKVVYIISHLTGRAELWAAAEWSRCPCHGWVTAREETGFGLCH